MVSFLTWCPLFGRKIRVRLRWRTTSLSSTCVVSFDRSPTQLDGLQAVSSRKRKSQTMRLLWTSWTFFRVASRIDSSQDWVRQQRSRLKARSRSREIKSSRNLLLPRPLRSSEPKRINSWATSSLDLTQSALHCKYCIRPCWPRFRCVHSPGSEASLECRFQGQPSQWFLNLPRKSSTLKLSATMSSSWQLTFNLKALRRSKRSSPSSSPLRMLTLRSAWRDGRLPIRCANGHSRSSSTSARGLQPRKSRPSETSTTKLTLLMTHWLDSCPKSKEAPLTNEQMSDSKRNWRQLTMRLSKKLSSWFNYSCQSSSKERETM